MSARPDQYSCQSWNVCAKVILQPYVRKHPETGGFSESCEQEEDSVQQNVSESEVFVTAVEDSSTVLETCQEDLTDHSVSETATISDTLVDTANNKENHHTSLQDSDSSRTVQIAECSTSDTVSEQPTNAAILPKAILDMCDQAADKIRNSLLCENLSGDVNCASDVDRLNKIIHEKEKDYSLVSTVYGDNRLTKSRKQLESYSKDPILVKEPTLSNESQTFLVETVQSSSSDTILADESSLSKTFLEKSNSSNLKPTQSNETQSLSSETLCIDESLSETILAQPIPSRRQKLGSRSSNSILARESSLSNTLLENSSSSIKESTQSMVSKTLCNNFGKNRNKDLSSSETLCIDESLSETILGQAAPKRRKKLETSSLDTILANESCLSNTLLVNPNSSIPKSTQIHEKESMVSETICNNLGKNRKKDLSSSETLCIDESFSDTILVETSPKRKNKLEPSSSCSILANESSLSKTFLVKPSSLIPKSTQINKTNTICNNLAKNKNPDLSTSETLCMDRVIANKSSQINEPRSVLSETVCNKLGNSRNPDLSSTDTLCINESMSEIVVDCQEFSVSNSSRGKETSLVSQTICKQGYKSLKHYVNKSDDFGDKTLQDVSVCKTFLSEDTLSKTDDDAVKTDLDSVTVQRTKSQDTSFSKTLNLDNSLSSETIMDTVSDQGTFSNKIQFGKRPKSALFNKIKDRYEKIESVNEDTMIDGNKRRKKLSESQITNQECVNNNNKTNFPEDTVKRKDIENTENTGEDKIQSNLRSIHSNVIEKLNTFYGERKDDNNANTHLAEKENNKAVKINQYGQNLEEIKTGNKEDQNSSEAGRQQQSTSNIDQECLNVANQHKNNDETEQKNTDKSTNEDIQAPEYKNKHEHVLHKILYAIPGLDDKNQNRDPETDKKDEYITTKTDAKDEITVSKTEVHTTPNTDKKEENIVYKTDKKYDYTIPKTANKDEQTTPKNDKKDENAIPKNNKKDEYNVPKTDKKSYYIIPKSDKKTNDQQYDDVCSISTESELTTKSEAEDKQIIEKSSNTRDQLDWKSKTSHSDVKKVGETSQDNPLKYTDFENKEEIFTDDIDKEVYVKQVGGNPFGNESINPFDDQAMVSPRRRMKTPTSNARRDLLGGGNKNQIIRNISDPSTLDNDMKDDTINTADIDNLKEPIQTPKRREKIVSKRALAESHIYEEIGPFTKDKESNLLNEKEIKEKNHMYDEIIKSKEQLSTNEDTKEQMGILGRIKNFVFRAYTAVTPWWVARRVYWRKERVGEEEFTAIVRRNSKTKNKGRTKHQGEEDLE